MSKEQKRPDSRLKNIDRQVDASHKKGAGNLIEVRKTDSAEDRDNEFVLHEKPFDEQMNESFEDLRKNNSDEDAD